MGRQLSFLAGDEAVRQAMRRKRKEAKTKMRDELEQQLKAREAELDGVKTRLEKLEAMAQTQIAEWNEQRHALAINYTRLEGAIMALKVALGTVAEVPQ